MRAFCKQHLTENTEAFADPRLELIIGDARAGLENYPGKFDVAGLGGRRIGCAELRALKYVRESWCRGLGLPEP